MEKTRFTIDFGEEAAQAVTELAKKKQLTKAEIVRRAVSLLYFVERELKDKDNRLSITKDGISTKEIVNLF